MNSFISYFKNFSGLWICILLVLGVEVLLRSITKLYYLDGGGAFLTTLKREVAEGKRGGDYDFIMLGDSRSLSIKGKTVEKGKGLSFYNLSLPAAGPRYFKYYLKKYVTNHQNLKAVVLTMDPEQLAHSKSMAFNSDPKLWVQYKHRLLNLFSLGEQWEQYRGRELFFIMKEAAPHIMLSIKHREGLEKVISGFKPAMVLQGKFPGLEMNLIIEKMMNESGGQINLGTYFKAPEDASRKTLGGYIKTMQKTDSDAGVLREFLEYTKSLNLPTIILDLPHAEGLNTTPYYKSAVKEIQSAVAEFNHAKYIRFPEADYAPELFSESIHYNPKGEERVNQEFDLYVWPELVSFAEKGIKNAAK